MGEKPNSETKLWCTFSYDPGWTEMLVLAYIVLPKDSAPSLVNSCLFIINIREEKWHKVALFKRLTRFSMK